MSIPVSFVIISDAHSDAVDKTVESINLLDAIETELLFAIPTFEETTTVNSSQDGADKTLFTSNSRHSLTNKAIQSAKGDYIQPLLAGQTIDRADFSKQLAKLDEHKEASCMVKGQTSPTATSSEAITAGPVFLFNCFDKVLSPVSSPAEILFRRAKVTLDHHLESLAYTDLALQLSKQGAIIVDSFSTKLCTVEPASLKEWLTMAQKYSSVLSCVGWSKDTMLEKIVEPLVRNANMLDLESQIEQGEFQLLRSTLGLAESKAEEKEQDDALLAAAQRVVLNCGAAQRQVRSAERIVIFSKEITERETELRALLESLSWRVTKLPRDLHLAVKYLNGTLDLRYKETPADKSRVEYLDYLNYQIEKIYKSRSWRISSPLRALVTDKKLNSLSSKANRA